MYNKSLKKKKLSHNKSLKKYNKKHEIMKIQNKNKKKLHKNKISKESDCELPFASFEGSINNSKYDMPIEDSLVKLLNTPFAPKTIKPTNDYYTYINDEWIKKTTKDLKPKNGAFYVQVDDFRIAQEKVYYELIDIVKKYTQTVKSKRSTLINNVYKSFLSLNSEKRKLHVNNYVNFLDKNIKSGNLWDFLGYLNKNEIISWGSPIFWSVLPDEKNSKIYANYISSPELTLYDWQLYDSDEGQDAEFIKYKKLVKSKYFKYIKDIFQACLPLEKNLNPQDVFDVENEILNAIGCTNKKIKDAPDFYNKISKKDALEKYGFDFEKFSEKLGFKKTPNFFITNNPNYLKCICEIMKKEWNTPKWRSYWLFIFLRQIIRFDKNLRNIYFEFNGRFLKGFTKKLPKEIYPIFALSATFNNFLTTEYIKKNWNEHHVNYVKNMADDLLIVFKRIIKRNTWLSPKAKSFALKKLDYMNLVIGKPNNIRYDPLLNYTDDDPWGNMEKLVYWKVEKYINLSNNEIIDIPQIDWNELKLVGTQAYIVNAFYQMDKNEIYIPLAYLQKPFIDLEERGIEYNLSRVGYTLAHEMSHSLDDLGSKYDHLGNLYDWWTEKDKKTYQKIIDDIIEQYQDAAKKDGIKFDASIATGENMADISGLAICEEYLRDFQDKNEDIVPIRSLSFQAFFVYFAIQQRQQISSLAIKAQLKTNPHPLDKYRTNCPLARLKLFRSIYNVEKGDNMWWKSTNTVWN
jgi:predicted metalloendopeptidase